ncbi:MAG: hypothetical protein ACKVJ1_09235 [Verrucomicrobiia bacterium]|jgi:archaellum component FlaC
MTWVSALGLFVFILVGPKPSNSLTQELELTQSKYGELTLQLELDKNESDLALSTLYRARVEYRDKEEEALSKINSLKSEVDGFGPRLSSIEKEIEAKSDELSKLEQKLSSAREPITEISLQIKPIEQERKLLEEEKTKLMQTLSLVTGEASQIESSFENLEIKRNVATGNFIKERNRLMDGIKKPHHIYYAENKEVVVANRAPSGKGIFINNGYEDGLRENMEFITRNENATSNLSFRLKVTLVQKTFSFLEFMDELQIKDSSFASVGQNLSLIRSGEFMEETDPVDENINVE